MKFCENCGTQLADDAVFCEECGAKQEVVSVSNEEAEKKAQEAPQKELYVPEVEPKLKEIKLSDTCETGKREIKGWLMILLLIICSPLVLVNLIYFLPEVLFWILFVGIQLFVLVLMWRKRTWKTWLKIAVTIAYVVSYIL